MLYKVQNGNKRYHFHHTFQMIYVVISLMNHDFPPSLSEYGKLRLPSSKSDILKCFDRNDLEMQVRPLVSACVLDGPAWVHLHPPKFSKVFLDYATQELIKPMLSWNEERIDVVFDVYNDMSLKSHTRDKRGLELCS